MEYQGIIFTTHARERAELRSLSLDDVCAVMRQPDKTYPGKKSGTTKFIRWFNGRQVQVVAAYRADQKKWMVISVWVRGEDDPTPLAWTLITFPFKLVWWLLKFGWRKLGPSAAGSGHSSKNR